MNAPAVILKKGRDKAIRNRHHWIFSGAIKALPAFDEGDILPVRSAEGDFLGFAYFNRKSSIIGRMLTFDKTPALEAIRQNLEKAIALRTRLLGGKTNACRLVNGEGDTLPGLVVDRYDDVLVIQVATLGMERLKPFVLDWLIKNCSPRSIYEKSDLPARREEGLADVEGRLYGDPVETVEIQEEGLRFLVEIAQGQKTGFYLDLRPLRRLVRTLASGKRVLNCFCYTGAFSVAALAGGAVQVDSVDSSERAISLAKKNVSLNGLALEPHGFIVGDVFEFLRRPELAYDFIILDPPAFAKKKTDVISACRGYKDINRLAMQKTSAGGFLLSLSCSHFVDQGLFQQVLFQAAQESGRGARILQRHRLAFDHPINIFHPESEYLKSFLLFIE